MVTPIAYTGTVEQGKFRPDSPAEFTSEFVRRNGKRVVVLVKDWRKNRSTNQNKYWWGVIVPMFASEDAMACTREEAHEALKAELNYDLKVIGDRAIRIPKSTADLNTLEFKELVERAHQLGAEMFGMDIPDPASPQAQAMMEAV